MSEAILAGLLLLLAILAVLSIRAGDLLIAAVTLGAYGFVMSLIWAAIGALDVAFTEAVVGAGASTVIMLAALLRTSRRRTPLPSRVSVVSVPLAVGVALALLYVAHGLPDVGDVTAPASRHVSPRYLAGTLRETATPNAVTSVLADYRGYDTLIETTVIFTAGLGVWLLLRRTTENARR